MITRRAILIGTAGLIGSAGLGLSAACTSSSVPNGVPDVDRGRSVRGSFVSAERRGARTKWQIAYPPGHPPGADLPVLVVLHGRGGDYADAFDGDLRLDYFLADVVHAGAAPFAIASVDGGDHDYWHARRDTGDSAGMVVREFIPLLASHGLRTARVGLLGWSMGGYGALYLAETLTERRCAVVVAESPAIWHEAGQSVEGAFDDAEDWRKHNIWANLARLDGIAVRVDCGDQDGFAAVTRDLRAAIRPRPAGGIETGAHDGTFWRSQAASQLRFVSRHL